MNTIIRLSTSLLILGFNVIALTQPAQATIVRWNTCDGGTSPDTTCSAQGVTVTETPRTPNTPSGAPGYVFGTAPNELRVSAYQTNNLMSGPITPTTITIFEGGLGAGTGSSPHHAVTNIGPDEFLVFTLPTDSTRPISFMIGWKSSDADIATWIGGTLGQLDPTALDSWDETINGWARRDFLNVPTGVSQVFDAGATGRYLVIGAMHETSTWWHTDKDAFKVLQVKVDVPSVPEPGTLLLLGTGLIALSLRRRQ
jgi:hypothetical protein